MTLEVARFRVFDTDENLTPVAGPGVTMPFQNVTMPPGVYNFGGSAWDCTRPGLYIFKHSTELYFRNRIVFGAAPFDPYPIVSAVCWNHVHGCGSETVGNLQPVSDSGRMVVWRMRCGFIGNYLAWLMPQFGFSVRQVGVHSLQQPPHPADNGHQVFEILLGGKWRMFDITNGCYWRDANGDHMSTAEFIAAIAGGAPLPQRLPLDGKQHRWDHEVLPGYNWDMGLYGNLVIGTDAQREAWTRRIFQALD